MTDTSSIEGGAKVDFAFLAGEIRGKLEKSLNRTFKQTDTVEQAIEIDGNELPKVKLIWVERIRIGSASVEVNGTVKKLPFEFREQIELRAIPLKSTP